MASGKKRPIRSAKTASGKRRPSKKRPRAVAPVARQRNLPTAELSARLGVSSSTVRRWAKRGLIPFTLTSLGHYEFYSVATVQSALETARQKQIETRDRERRRRTKKKLLAQKKKKKRGKTVRRPKAPGSRPRPSDAYEPRPVEASESPTVDEASRRFRLTAERLFEEILAGNVRAVMDGDGVLRVPQLDLQLRTWQGRKRRRKKRQSRASRYEEAARDDQRPAPRSAAALSRQDAIEVIGPIMRDLVTSRSREDRLAFGAEFKARKDAFRQAWGNRRWKEAYSQLVDDWGLDDYIVDYEALRDS